MFMMADEGGVVYGGVDTHAEVHVAAAVDPVGRVLGTESFPVSAQGYAALLGWLAGFGKLARAGVEGTGSYGAGLARFLAAAGVAVLEVNRPDRQRRRRYGKSDPADAVSAALAALRGQDCGTPKSADGTAESLRVLRAARRGAVKARSQAGNQLRDLLVTAPGELRAELTRPDGRALAGKALASACAVFAGPRAPGPAAMTRTAMASIARRWQQLDQEAAALDAAMEDLAAAAAPDLLARTGIGAQSAAALLIAAGDNPARIGTEAAYAALCGVSPVDCSSGKHERHRLNRGGDRQANSALWRIVQTRLQHDPRTIAYLEKRTKEGKTRKEIIRALKRYVAREVWKIIVRPTLPPRHDSPATSHLTS
jgi:transposase